MTTAPSTQPVALVAGGSRGLGLLVARELVGHGYRVAVCARDLDEAREGAAQVGAYAYRCDVSEKDEVAALVEQVEGEMGPIEVLIHVAGIIQVGPAESMTVEHFEDAVGTMLMGPVHTAWAVLPGMRQRGRGRIGVVTSVGGKVSPPHLLPYSTAKFGAVGFTEGLSAELAGTGVTATTIVPGLMRTGSHEQALFTGDHAAEYAWFAPAASLPVLSMNAERAARRMVDGVLGGKPLVVLSWLSHAAIRAHGLSPTLTVHLMGLVNRFLPTAAGQEEGHLGGTAKPQSVTTAHGPTVSGRQAAQKLGTASTQVVGVLTTLGRRAAGRFNQR